VVDEVEVDIRGDSSNGEPGILARIIGPLEGPSGGQVMNCQCLSHDKAIQCRGNGTEMKLYADFSDRTSARRVMDQSHYI